MTLSLTLTLTALFQVHAQIQFVVRIVHALYQGNSTHNRNFLVDFDCKMLCSTNEGMSEHCVV